MSAAGPIHRVGLYGSISRAVAAWCFKEATALIHRIAPVRGTGTTPAPFYSKRPSSPMRLWKTAGSLVVAIVLALRAAPTQSVGQISGHGRISGAISLSSSTFGSTISGAPTGAVVSTAGAGADITEFIDFGDLTVAGGEPVQATVRMQLRGNASFRLNISLLSYSATTLMFGGRDVSTGRDRGSFITVRGGMPVGTGGRADVQAIRINPAVQAGITLDNISEGPVMAHSTTIAEGSAPSLGGTASSADNAVDVPVTFSVPTGLIFAPTRGASSGHFKITVQIGAFAEG